MYADRIRILADYMIAVHAASHADQRLTRDAEFTRMKVPGLAVVTPAEILGGFIADLSVYHLFLSVVHFHYAHAQTTNSGDRNRRTCAGIGLGAGTVAG